MAMEISPWFCCLAGQVAFLYYHISTHKKSPLAEGLKLALIYGVMGGGSGFDYFSKVKRKGM
jgi:hypothetical protein